MQQVKHLHLLLRHLPRRRGYFPCWQQLLCQYQPVTRRLPSSFKNQVGLLRLNQSCSRRRLWGNVIQQELRSLWEVVLPLLLPVAVSIHQFSWVLPYHQSFSLSTDLQQHELQNHHINQVEPWTGHPGRLRSNYLLMSMFHSAVARRMRSLRLRPSPLQLLPHSSLLRPCKNLLEDHVHYFQWLLSLVEMAFVQVHSRPFAL